MTQKKYWRIAFGALLLSTQFLPLRASGDNARFEKARSVAAEEDAEEVRVAQEKARQARAAEQAQRDAYDQAFIEKLRNGQAKRFELGDGIVLDLVKIGTDKNAFYIGRFEVTQEQFKQVLGPKARLFMRAGEEKVPVVDCPETGYDDLPYEEFLRLLNIAFQEERGEYVFTLPTISQWRQAARAGENTKYAGSDNLHEVAWNGRGTYEWGGPRPHAVGLKKPNAYLLHDMTGNACERCLNDDGSDDGVCLGGSWRNKEWEDYFETSYDERVTVNNDCCFQQWGFRVVLGLPVETMRKNAIEAKEQERQTRIAAEKARIDALNAAEKARVDALNAAEKIQEEANERELQIRLSEKTAKRFDLGNGCTLDMAKVTESFYMGCYEITQEQYERVMGANPSSFAFRGRNRGKHPVENVSWEQAQAFCDKLNGFLKKERGRFHFSLPTVSQWEKAAYGDGDTWTPYSGGNDLDELGWYKENSNGETHHVGMKKPNGYGIFDMSGNVWEWCEDRESYFVNGVAVGVCMLPCLPFWFIDTPREIRGGSFDCPENLSRIDKRFSYRPDYTDRSQGFRVVLEK